ncbi:type II toxin-antitoxin system PemK/MazF family toxin [bacterium]|nr:type II toxin-antitoxin system PemK/MazF family toxin [bacterium]
MKRGDIRWYRFQPPDKKRPVLILTRNSIIQYMNEVTVAPLTTTIRAIPSEVIVGVQEGLKKKCAINCDHLQTVSKVQIGDLITSLPNSKLEQVTDAIRFALDL